MKRKLRKKQTGGPKYPRNTKSIKKHVDKLSDKELQELADRNLRAKVNTTTEFLQRTDTINAIRNKLVQDFENEQKKDKKKKGGIKGKKKMMGGGMKKMMYKSGGFLEPKMPNLDDL